MRKFTPDCRNYGGRKVISDHFRFHYFHLANARATLKTRATANRSFNQSTSVYKGNESFHVTRHNKLLLSEHMLNIKHMNRRIRSIGSYNERKKNQFDPITHPVVFFRSKNNTPDPILDQRFINRSTKPMKINRIYSERRKRRPATSVELEVEIPFIDKSERNQVGRLKEELMKTIVDNRIYKEQDIQDLFRFTREANPHLEKDVLDKALAHTYQNLSF